MPSAKLLGVGAILGSLVSGEPASRYFKLQTRVESLDGSSTELLNGKWITTQRTGAGHEIWIATDNETDATTWFLEDTKIVRIPYGNTKYAMNLGGAPVGSDAPAGLNAVTGDIVDYSHPTANGFDGFSVVDGDEQGAKLVNANAQQFQWSLCFVNTTIPFVGVPAPGIQVFWFNPEAGIPEYPTDKCATVSMMEKYV